MGVKKKKRRVGGGGVEGGGGGGGRLEDTREEVYFTQEAMWIITEGYKENQLYRESLKVAQMGIKKELNCSKSSAKKIRMQT